MINQYHDKFLRIRNLDRLLGTDKFLRVYKFSSIVAKSKLKKLLDTNNLEGVRLWIERNDNKDYGEMTIRELRVEARRNGVLNVYNLTKFELIWKIMELK